MKTILKLISEDIEQAFEDAGYRREFGRVTLSNRPDLCEYQCNGAMAAAKEYHKAPAMIAQDVLKEAEKSEKFSELSVVNPGFLNIKLSGKFLKEYLDQMITEIGLDRITDRADFLAESCVTEFLDHRPFSEPAKIAALGSGGIGRNFSRHITPFFTGVDPVKSSLRFFFRGNQNVTCPDHISGS